MSIPHPRRRSWLLQLVLQSVLVSPLQPQQLRGWTRIQVHSLRESQPRTPAPGLVPQLDLHHLDFTKNPDRATYDCDESQFRHVLSYVAGVTPLARASALATIESWFVEAEREAGWPIQE